MSSLRTIASQTLLRGLCWASSLTASEPAGDGLHRTRIWGGPLRGMQFAMPRLERLAFAFGTYEPEVVEVIRIHARPGGVAYDLGANAGYHTLAMARAVGKSGRVFAFEPDGKSLNALKANIRLNKLNHVAAVPKAVSKETGTITFASYDYSLVGHIIRPNTSEDANLHKVPTVTLDDFVFNEGNPPPDFIKIDVEGSEELVLLGAEQVLREIRPVIIAETRSGWMWEHVSAMMKRHGYAYQFLASEEALESEFFGDVLFLPR